MPEYIFAEECEYNGKDNTCTHPKWKGKKVSCGMMFISNCDLLKEDKDLPKDGKTTFVLVVP